jgi:hypothetical protein
MAGCTCNRLISYWPHGQRDFTAANLFALMGNAAECWKSACFQMAVFIHNAMLSETHRGARLIATLAPSPLLFDGKSKPYSDDLVQSSSPSTVAFGLHCRHFRNTAAIVTKAASRLTNRRKGVTSGECLLVQSHVINDARDYCKINVARCGFGRLRGSRLTTAEL